MKSISDLVNKVKKAFKSKEYRHAYADEFLDVSIATQIKILRQQRKWGQKHLAKLVGMEQPRISVMENVNYSSWSINTLRKLAKAFDLTLRVSFESFGDRIKEIEQFNRKALERPSFKDDPVFATRKIHLSTACCATTTTSDVILTITEAHKELPRSNEIPEIDLVPKKALPSAIPGINPVSQITNGKHKPARMAAI